VQWYHYQLCHPGINRTEETIGQHFYGPKMREQIMNGISSNKGHLSNSKKNNPKSMDFCLKRMQKQCRGTDYASISLVHTILKVM
jgi:hypothetical protein